MNPLAKIALDALPFVLDLVLTKKKDQNEEIKSKEPEFDPSATMIQQAKKHVAAEASKREVSLKKASTSTVVTTLGFVLYFVVKAGYLSPASMQCMIDAASEVEAKIVQEQQAK